MKICHKSSNTEMKTQMFKSVNRKPRLTKQNTDNLDFKYYNTVTIQIPGKHPGVLLKPGFKARSDRLLDKLLEPQY